jgi:hypothetical protein
LLLAAGPREVLDHQDAQAAEQMHRKKKYQPAFGEFHNRLIAPAQKTFEFCVAFDGEAERQEMQRQKNREPQAGNPVHHGGDPQRAAAIGRLPRDHGNTTAAMARKPSTKSRTPKAMA